MMDATKYAPGYYPVPAGYDSWVKKDHIEKAPAWCSVDLRDGNQALIVPMSLEEKLEFFQMLVKIGFKEIEVGFPAASDTEYEFLRTLIEKNMIPEDVTVQVLTQCRDHIIRKTFEAVKGAPRAVIHFYNSTSVAQREQVFHKSREEIKKIATDGAKLVKQLSQEYEGNFLFEYSPESFTGPVNTGNPGEFTIKELAEMIVSKIGGMSKIVYKDLPSDDPTQRRPDISQAKSQLGWEPKIQLNEGLDKTIAYFKTQINLFEKVN